MNDVIPALDKFDVNVWIDEAIWGHRFYNDQTPWLVFLEFLCVFRARHIAGCALDESLPEGGHEKISYSVPRSLPLRELVFNNPHLQQIEAAKRSDNEKWIEWSKYVGGYDFSFLKHRFDDKFSRLTHVVEYFQNTAVEPHRKRRWTSRFNFPHGPDCLYADLPKDPHGSPDRRFFARGGELLYLMLCRSGCGPDIAKLIDERLLRAQDPWNRVAKVLLLHADDGDTIYNTVGYLPCAERPEYKELAKTWKQLLRLQLPGAVLFDPLVRLSSLHMLIYMLRRAADVIGGEKVEPRFVLEIAAPSKTILREVSSESLQANRMSTLRAVRAYVESARADQRWHHALNARVPADAVRDFLIDRFAWKGAPEVGDHNYIFSELRSYAEKRHKQHVFKVHNEWTKQIGLTFSQRRAGTWYAPSDSLLKALVMCIVEGRRKEYHRFLEKLYERFSIVIDAPEAKKAFGGTLPIDQHAFTLNAQRLEQRLRTLGLLRRLSDDCAYVLNPFGGMHDSK